MVTAGSVGCEPSALLLAALRSSPGGGGSCGGGVLSRETSLSKVLELKALET